MFPVEKFFFEFQIVHNQTEPSEKLLKYKAELEGYGALVKMVPAGDMNCVLKSQIIRVLAFLLPEVPKQCSEQIEPFLNFYTVGI